MKHRLIALLVGLLVLVGMLTLRPGQDVHHPVSVTVDDTAGMLDEGLAGEIEAADFGEPVRILVYSGDGENSPECRLEEWCLETIYPDLFDERAVMDDVMVVWFKPTQNFATILLPPRAAYQSDVEEVQAQIAQDLSYAWATGELDNSDILAALSAGDRAYFSAVNEGAVRTSHIIQAITGALIAGVLTWIILAAWRQYHGRHYQSRAERREAIAQIRAIFTRASHDLDRVALDDLDRHEVSSWNADYVALTRGLASADFLEADRYSRARYDGAVFALDQLARKVEGPATGRDEPATSAFLRTRSLRLPLHPLTIATCCLGALLIGFTTGVITAATSEEEVVYAEAPADLFTDGEMTEAKSQRARAGEELEHFSSITIHDTGGLIEDPEALTQALMTLGFEGSVPLVVMTYDGPELERRDLYWDQWLVPTYPEDVDTSSEYPFYFRDTGTVYLWYAPGPTGARGVDYNRFTTDLAGPSSDLGYRARFDPKGSTYPDSSAELMVWNAMTDLAMWSTAEDPDTLPIASRSFTRGLVATIVSLPILLGLAYGATILVRRRRDPRQQFEQVRAELTHLGLARDALRLDTLLRGSEQRWQAFDHAYVNAVRHAGGDEHLADARASFLSRTDRDLAIGWTYLAKELADSLWRASAVCDGDRAAQAEDIAGLAQVDRDQRRAYEAAKADPERIDQLAARNDRAAILRGLVSASDDDVRMLSRLGGITSPVLGHRSFDLEVPDHGVGRTRVVALACVALALAGIAANFALTPRTALYTIDVGDERVETRVESWGHIRAVNESSILAATNRHRDSGPLLTDAHIVQGVNMGTSVQLALDASEEAGYCTSANHSTAVEATSPVYANDSPWHHNYLAPNVVWVCLDPTTPRITASPHLVARTSLKLDPGELGDQIDQVNEIFGRGPVFDQVFFVDPQRR